MKLLTIKDRVQGVTPELLELYKDVCSSTIGHLTDFGFLKGLKPLTSPIRILGNAVTVRIPHMDSTVVHKSLDLIEEGDVLIIDMSGDVERACVGEIVAYAAKVKGVGGIIIDGCITDVLAMKELGIPIFSRGVSPLTTRVLGIEGEVNTTISVCGTSVNPGDLIVGDDDGVFVISPNDAEEYAEISIKKQNNEEEIKRKLDCGDSLVSLGRAKHYF